MGLDSEIPPDSAIRLPIELEPHYCHFGEAANDGLHLAVLTFEEYLVSTSWNTCEDEVSLPTMLYDLQVAYVGIR